LAATIEVAIRTLKAVGQLAKLLVLARDVSVCGRESLVIVPKSGESGSRILKAMLESVDLVLVCPDAVDIDVVDRAGAPRGGRQGAEAPHMDFISHV
jgi:hypothetical protein